MNALTDYQKAQLLNLHLTGEFCYRNKKGNRVSSQAWRTMFDVLTDHKLIDSKLRPTAKAIAYLDKNHAEISLKPLE